MAFTLFPAVDVSDGRAVRPVQGVSSAADMPMPNGTEADPLEAARAWQRAGAEWIHLVDLDAAFGRGSNADLLASIARELDVNVQLSGGITDDESLSRALHTGCSRAVLATTALDDLRWCATAFANHGERIAAALDVRISAGPDGTLEAQLPDHQLIPRGSSAETGPDLWETLADLDRVGCRRYVVTDVSKEGMLSGPNLELYREVLAATTTPVIASGGVSEVADLERLSELAADDRSLEGSIVGKALYAGHLSLSEAFRTLQS